MHHTMMFLAGQDPAPPSVVADAITVALTEPETSVRVVAGAGSAELIRVRSSMTDDEWIVTAGGPTRDFAETYLAITGHDLTAQRPERRQTLVVGCPPTCNVTPA